MYGTSPIELLATDAMMQGLIYCQNYVYSAQWIAGTTFALGANQTVDFTTQINGDSDFIIQQINLVAMEDVDTPITDPDYLIQISIGGSARQLFDRPISVNALFGNYLTDKVPGSLPFPYLVEMNNNLLASLTNRTGDAANRVDLVYNGFRVFYQGAAAPSELRKSIFKKYIS